MTCWCGHEHWHHHHGPWQHYGRHYPPPYPAPGYYPPENYYGPPRGPARHRPDPEELADYLQHLEEEVAQVRTELEAIRAGGTSGD